MLEGAEVHWKELATRLASDGSGGYRFVSFYPPLFSAANSSHIGSDPHTTGATYSSFLFFFT